MKYAKFCRELRKYGEVDKSWSAVRVDQKVLNHTIPVAIRELKPQYKPCELGCGESVSNQHIEHRWIREHKIWLKRCDHCHRYQDPETLEVVDHRCLVRFFNRK